MSHAMTRTRANAIRAVGLSAGALLAVAAGALAVTSGADPASITPGEVKVPDLAPQKPRQEIYPDEIATWISTAYRHDFPDETPEQPETSPTPPAAPGATVRLVGVIGAGDRSMAIVGVDAQQFLLAAGESGPDFRIEEIHDDHIVMVRNGRRSEVRLGERQGPLAGDIRPGGGGYGTGAVAGSQGVHGQVAGRSGTDGRGERDQYLEARRREVEERRAAARALEAGGGGDEDAVPPTALGNGNSFTSAAGGANGANGANGPSAPEGAAQRTQRRQTGGRPGGNGASNN